MTKDFLNEAACLVRAPLDPGTGLPLERCRYALFPGIALAESEPELVVLMYDSILHQHPDTAMFLYKGRDGADPLLNRKWSERLLTRWRNLGKPTMIVVTPEDMKFFRGVLTEIPTVSLYDELLAHHVSGGCSRELYRLCEPEQYGCADAVRRLAENMGAVLCGEKGEHASPSGESSDGAPELSAGDLARVPYLTSSIDLRNAMKKKGFPAVHILELIYGMGRSNAHLAHSHGEGEEHEHEHDQPPAVRDIEMSAEEKAAQADLFSPEVRKRNLMDVHDSLLALYWGE